MLSIVKGR